MLHNSNLNEEKNGVLHFQQKAGAPYTQTYTRCRLVLSLIFLPQLGVCSQARAGLSAELSPAGNGKARDGYNTMCFSVLSYYNLAGYIVNYFIKNEQVPFIFQLHIFSSIVKINCRCCWQETFHKTFFFQHPQPAKYRHGSEQRAVRSSYASTASSLSQMYPPLAECYQEDKEFQI